jgi:hypothetical protein
MNADLVTFESFKKDVMTEFKSLFITLPFFTLISVKDEVASKLKEGCIK